MFYEKYHKIKFFLKKIINRNSNKNISIEKKNFIKN